MTYGSVLSVEMQFGPELCLVSSVASGLFFSFTCFIQNGDGQELINTQSTELWSLCEAILTSDIF